MNDADFRRKCNQNNHLADTLQRTPDYRERLRKGDMNRVSEFILENVGIQLPESKHILVEGRLRKRLHALGFTKFRDYLDHALDDSEYRSERLHLIDAITTNKTEFFREPEHFEYLLSEVLPIVENNRIRDNRKELCLWSAGCSTGEEPYTLSMIMHEAAELLPGLKFNILATDISQSCLTTACSGVYTEKHIFPVSMELRKKYFLRSKNSDEHLICMGPELKSKVRFEVLNLIDKQYNLKQKMDVIFCRNVMIYFNKIVCEELIERFTLNLVQGGYLFVGHSESLNGIQTALRQVAPMIYRKL